MSSRSYMLLAAGLVFGGALFSQAQKDHQPRKRVDVKADLMRRNPTLPENAVVMVGDVAFHHNGAVISCDSAVRYSDQRIDCFHNVIINKDETFVYGDRAEYNGEMDLARVYSPVVKVTDGDAVLYTYNFTFNTRTNIGRWFGGGVMYQKDNVMESERGFFYSDRHELVAFRGVEMRSDSHQIVSDSVRYNTETRVATFYTKTHIWTKDGEMIRANRGRYNTRDSAYFFWGDAYVLDEFRETWADTIDFRARTEDIFLHGNIQIDDDEHKSSAFGDYGRYWGERGETMLTRRPSLLNYNADQGNSDTLYMRADTVFMFVRYPSDSPRRADSMVRGGSEAHDPMADLRWIDSLPEGRRRAMADSLQGVVNGLRAVSEELRGRADSIMNALYPPSVPAPEAVETADRSTPDVGQPTDSSRRTRRKRARGPMAEMFDRYTPWYRPDTLPTRAPLVDTVSYAGLGEVADSVASGSRQQPPRIETPAVVRLRGDAGALSTRADSVMRVVDYLVRSLPAPAAQPVDSVALARAAELARLDSLAHTDSVFRADPRAFKMHQKELERARKAAAKEERQRLKDEKHAARVAEKERERAAKVAARAALKEAQARERRRRFAMRRGLPFTDGAAGARVDSLSRADSLARLDSLAGHDSLRVDSLARIAKPDTTATAPDTTMRIFKGWRGVRIWRKDLQAVCDSMVGFSADSTLHMYTDPVMWNGESQIVADSMRVRTAGGEIERAEFFGDPIMSSQVSARQFNQVKGRTMTARFRQSTIYRHDVVGNVQALYYMQEEGNPDPVAFLVVSASDMTFLVESDSLRYMIARENVEWPVYPMDQIPADQPTELKGFKWLPERRPTLRDVFDRSVRPTERAFHEGMPHPEFPIAARIARRREYLIANRMWADRTDPLPGHAAEWVLSLGE